MDSTGRVIAIHGLLIDLTRAIALESGHAATSALVNTYATRSVIEQAKGILMGHFTINPVESFDRLSKYSQNTNIKVSSVAAGLVAAASQGRLPEVLHRLTQSAGHERAMKNRRRPDGDS